MAVRRIKGAWWIDVWHRGVRYRRKSPVDALLAARRHERLFVERLERNRVLDLRDPFDLDPGVRFEAFAHAWFNAYVKANTRPSTQIGYESVLRRALLPYFGGIRLEDITTLSVEAFKLMQIEKGVSRKTINNMLAVLRRALRSALDWEILAHLPEVKFLVTTVPRFRYLTAEEGTALLHAEDRPMWKRLFLCALRTGMRTGELLALRWEDVDLVGGVLHVRRSIVAGDEGPPKNGLARILPISPDLHLELADMKRTGGYVFAQPDGRPLTWRLAHKALGQVAKKAGLAPIGLHALRHSFATRLAQCEVSITTIQSLLGHSTLHMTQRYVHPAADTLREAVFGLESRT